MGNRLIIICPLTYQQVGRSNRELVTDVGDGTYVGVVCVGVVTSVGWCPYFSPLRRHEDSSTVAEARELHFQKPNAAAGGRTELLEILGASC